MTTARSRRELLLLAILAANDGAPIQGRTRLMKMVFLLQMELDDGDDSEWANRHDRYHFIPYDY